MTFIVVILLAIVGSCQGLSSFAPSSSQQQQQQQQQRHPAFLAMSSFPKESTKQAKLVQYRFMRFAVSTSKNQEHHLRQVQDPIAKAQLLVGLSSIALDCAGYETSNPPQRRNLPTRLLTTIGRIYDWPSINHSEASVQGVLIAMAVANVFLEEFP